MGYKVASYVWHCAHTHTDHSSVQLEISQWHIVSWHTLTTVILKYEITHLHTHTLSHTHSTWPWWEWGWWYWWLGEPSGGEETEIAFFFPFSTAVGVPTVTADLFLFLLLTNFFICTLNTLDIFLLFFLLSFFYTSVSLCKISTFLVALSRARSRSVVATSESSSCLSFSQQLCWFLVLLETRKTIESEDERLVK